MHDVKCCTQAADSEPPVHYVEYRGVPHGPVPCSGVPPKSSAVKRNAQRSAALTRRSAAYR